MDTTILRFRGLRLRDCDAGSMTRQPLFRETRTEGLRLKVCSMSWASVL